MRQALLPSPHKNQTGRQTARLTGNGADHGHRGEDACQALATHDGGRVAGRQEASQTKQAALQDGTKCWGNTVGISRGVGSVGFASTGGSWGSWENRFL